MNNILNEAEFSFIQNGNVFFVEKDKHNVLYNFVALTEIDVLMFLNSRYKTIVRNMRGEVTMKNFNGDVEKKTYDLTGVHQLLSEVEESYSTKEKLLEDIDKALLEGNKEEFVRLTNQLKEVS